MTSKYNKNEWVNNEDNKKFSLQFEQDQERIELEKARKALQGTIERYQASEDETWKILNDWFFKDISKADERTQAIFDAKASYVNAHYEITFRQNFATDCPWVCDICCDEDKFIEAAEKAQTQKIGAFYEVMDRAEKSYPLLANFKGIRVCSDHCAAKHQKMLDSVKTETVPTLILDKYQNEKNLTPLELDILRRHVADQPSLYWEIAMKFDFPVGREFPWYTTDGFEFDSAEEERSYFEGLKK